MNSPQPTASHAIVTQRRLPYPRERVCGAFTDPVILARWWGPAGFTNTIERFELRPGGAWHLVMRGPDGIEYPNVSEFTTVNPPAVIAFRHVGSVHGFVLTMTFEPDAGQTVLKWSMVFDDPAEAERLRSFIIPANEQNLDRLAAVLAANPP